MRQNYKNSVLFQEIMDLTVSTLPKNASFQDELIFCGQFVFNPTLKKLRATQ